MIFIHGLMSSPQTWIQMINTLSSDPEIRSRYQFWFYTYSSGNPVLISAGKMREAVDAWYRDSHPAKYHLEFLEPDLLRDTRPCAAVPEYRLSAAEQAVLRAARSPADRAAVEAAAGNSMQTIEKMKEHGYLIEVGGRLLALPLIPPSGERIAKSRLRYRSLFRGQTPPAASVQEETPLIKVGV